MAVRFGWTRLVVVLLGGFALAPEEAVGQEPAVQWPRTDAPPAAPAHAPAGNTTGRLFAGSRIPMERCPTTAGAMGTATPANRSVHVKAYPQCKMVAVDSVDDKDYMIKQLQAAPTMKIPFASSTYFCNLLPSHLYTEIIDTFPPDKLFPNHVAKENSCGKGGCRYSMSASDLVKRKTAPANYPKWAQARSLYKKLQSIVFSREFESALFKKLGVTKGVKAREFRILSDKHGYSNGRIHTDLSARKVATMMWYLPVTDNTVWDYGTCLHSTQQWKSRAIKAGGKHRGSDGVDGEGDCYFKFRFLPNSGYSFKTGQSSWHSAPNFFIKHWDEYDRNTILLNWYY